MGFTFYIGELRVFFPYDSIYPEQCPCIFFVSKAPETGWFHLGSPRFPYNPEPKQNGKGGSALDTNKTIWRVFS